MEPRAERIAIPQTLMGKTAAVFYLLNELERRKAQKKAARPATVPQAPRGTQTAKVPRPKPLLLTDEFLFA